LEVSQLPRGGSQAEAQVLEEIRDELKELRMLYETLRRYFDVKELNRAAVKPGSFNERR